MNEQPQINSIELLDDRSDQVKEILGRTPNWMIRWGISVVLIILTIILVGSAFISYNDVIPSQIVITSKNPPIYLKARTTGRLTKILIEPGQRVNKGAVLAEIENTASYDDVQYLQNKLNENLSIKTVDILKQVFPNDLNLGDLQLSYGNFINAYQRKILFQTLAPNNEQQTILAGQLIEQNKFLNNLKRQMKIFEQNLELSKQDFERNKKLYDKGVISLSEYEAASKRFLNEQQQFENMKATIFQTQISINEYDGKLKRNKIEETEFENTYDQELLNAEQNLKSALSLWEQQFLIKSPINGRVTVFDVWNQYQSVEIGKVLFTIVPLETSGIIGRVSLPVRNSGKVKTGQKVIVKLDNYPFEEWGSLEGRIESVSEVPQQNSETLYTLFVSFKTLKTTYGKIIDFKQEMGGTAEIITEELSVLERVFYDLRKVFSR